MVRFQPNTKIATLVFGLFHGFGLATKIIEYKISPDGLVPNLLAFNVGVEIGQLLALAAILIAMSYWRRSASFVRHAYSANVVMMSAGFILVGMQLTGIGRILGMTQMGQIKKQLATEAAADARLAAPPETVSPSKPELAVVSATPAIAPKAQSQMQWRDEIPFELNPGQGIEIKLKMLERGKAQYSWVVEAGSVNFDTHADGSGKSISYQKGCGVSANEGVLTAAFTGNHGWFGRNRGKEKVKVILRTRGGYSEVKR